MFDKNVHKQNFLNIILRLNTFYVKVYKLIAYKKKKTFKCNMKYYMDLYF